LSAVEVYITYVSMLTYMGRPKGHTVKSVIFNSITLLEKLSKKSILYSFYIPPKLYKSFSWATALFFNFCLKTPNLFNNQAAGSPY